VGEPRSSIKRGRAAVGSAHTESGGNHNTFLEVFNIGQFNVILVWPLYSFVFSSALSGCGARASKRRVKGSPPLIICRHNENIILVLCREAPSAQEPCRLSTVARGKLSIFSCVEAERRLRVRARSRSRDGTVYATVPELQVEFSGVRFRVQVYIYRTLRSRGALSGLSANFSEGPLNVILISCRCYRVSFGYHGPKLSLFRMHP